MTEIYTAKRASKPRLKINVKEKPTVILCALSLFAVESNIYLSALPLVFLLLCKEKQSRYICSVITALYYAATVITTSFYIPHISFVLLFLAGDYLLPQGKVKPLYPALAVFCLSKLYVLSFGYGDVYYWVMTAEGVTFLFVPQIVQNGENILKNNVNIISSLQLMEAATAMLIVASALSGIKIGGLNISASFLLSLSFFYSLKNNMPLSMLGTVCTVLSLYGNSNFTYLFAGFFIIGFASFALLQRGYAGYLGVLLVAFAVTIAFITSFNSFIFLSVTAAALVGCFCFAKAYVPSKANIYSETTAEKDYIQLKNEIEKLTRTFSFLGHTVIDISALMTDSDIPKEITDIVAKDVCKSCDRTTLCWQQHYGYTQGQFSKCASALQKNKPFTFDGLLISRCDKTERIAQSFIAANRLLNTQKMMSAAGKHNQKILQNQFLNMSGILQDIVYRHSRQGTVNTACTNIISNLLLAMGKRINYTVCYQNPGSCVVDTPEYLTPSETEKIRLKLESIYNTRFNIPVKEETDSSIIYTYSETAAYTVEFAAQSQSFHGVCGDICESFASENYHYVILADGMGTGSFAAAESRTAVAMLKSLLSAKVSPQTAVDITNTAINLKGTGQSCVALDILKIDCHSGNALLVKAGGAHSLLVQSGRAKAIREDSLPIGILKDTQIAETELSLKNGDTILLLSDGVKADKALLQRAQMLNESMSCEKLAASVISYCEGNDDATAAVIKLIRA